MTNRAEQETTQENQVAELMSAINQLLVKLLRVSDTHKKNLRIERDKEAKLVQETRFVTSELNKFISLSLIQLPEEVGTLVDSLIDKLDNLKFESSEGNLAMVIDTFNKVVSNTKASTEELSIDPENPISALFSLLGKELDELIIAQIVEILVNKITEIHELRLQIARQQTAIAQLKAEIASLKSDERADALGHRLLNLQESLAAATGEKTQLISQINEMEKYFEKEVKFVKASEAFTLVNALRKRGDNKYELYKARMNDQSIQGLLESDLCPEALFQISVDQELAGITSEDILDVYNLTLEPRMDFINEFVVRFLASYPEKYDALLETIKRVLANHKENVIILKLVEVIKPIQDKLVRDRTEAKIEELRRRDEEHPGRLETLSGLGIEQAITLLTENDLLLLINHDNGSAYLQILELILIGLFKSAGKHKKSGELLRKLDSFFRHDPHFRESLQRLIEQLPSLESNYNIGYFLKADNTQNVNFCDDEEE